MIKNYFKSKSKKYFLATIILSILCPVLAFSYSSFVFTSEDYRASEMYIGSLLYGIKIDGESISSVTVPDGESEYVIEITSLNTVSSFYKLIYSTNPNIEVRYNKEENDLPSGDISNKRTIKVSITNLSKENIEVEFGVAAGYITNDLESVQVKEGYTEVKDFYEANDIKVLALYVNDEIVSSLDNSKDYYLKSYSCTNDEKVVWSNTSKSITVLPITTKTNCKLYFEDMVSLYDRILADNDEYADNVASTYVTSETGINFSAISSDTNGKGLYYTETNTDEDGDGVGAKIYYFRGAIENNYLIFAEKCWRIVRTNENGSIKLRYGGEPTNGDCPQTGSNINIASETVVYSELNDDTKNVGYTYDTGESNAKTIIDDWYKNNIVSQGENVTGLVADTIYCNDRTTYISNEETGSTSYGAHKRLHAINTNKTPQFGCPNPSSDGYTLPASEDGEQTYGNGLLTYPVALITADEIAYAGGMMGSDNSNESSYLSTASGYWTMSPSTGSYVFTMHTKGSLGDYIVSATYSVIPALSIVANANISSGSGTYNNPYIVEVE